MKAFFGIMLLLLSLQSVLTRNILSSSLVPFCKANGLRYLRFVSNGMKVDRDLIQEIYENGLQVGLKKEILNFNQDTQIIIFENFNALDKSHKWINAISKHKIKRSILTFTNTFDKINEENLLTFIKSKFQDKNSFFYLIYPNFKNEMIFKQILSLTNNTIVSVQDLTFQNGTYVIKEHYNLEQMKILSNTQSWHPYLMLNNCDQEGRNCEIEGFLASLMDSAGKKLNFTWTSFNQVDGNWGLKPDPITGEFSGVFGSLINHEVHTCISQWNWRSNRDPYVDFVFTGSTKRVMLLNTNMLKGGSGFDFGFFFRPFTFESWIGILFTIIICLFSIILPNCFIKENIAKFNGYNGLLLTTWVFFLMINSYLGGALTMFFSSEKSIPFNSIEDVIRGLLLLKSVDFVFNFNLD